MRLCNDFIKSIFMDFMGLMRMMSSAGSCKVSDGSFKNGVLLVVIFDANSMDFSRMKFKFSP